ncbi:MAG: SOS response-associated peptidase [Myxococcota bacterium]
MCGRYAMTSSAQALADVFSVEVLPEVLPRYNIAPTTQVPAVVVDDSGTRTLSLFRWGLIPSWSKDKKGGARMINARSETVASKPAFRAAFKRRRVLIVADGFYEWERIGKGKAAKKIPHLIQVTGGVPFGMAGLWERWIDAETDEEIRSCTIVTTEGNTLMQPIHDRMPVILPEIHWERWLDPAVQDRDELQEMLIPYDPDRMQERRVSKAVGNVRNQGPDVQGPYEESDG